VLYVFPSETRVFHTATLVFVQFTSISFHFVLANACAATSNAPRVGAKRRMADEDRDEDDEQARLKKVRGATDEAQADARESSSTPLPQANEAADVKEVTQGVKEVELDYKPKALP
jgi:hypothetical protein